MITRNKKYASTIIERFFNKVKKTKSCWIWTASSTWGYGYFSIKSKSIRAHRFSYELSKGKIPKGLQIDHLCRNRLCVNPDHLEAVTQKENIMRGIGITAINKNKTHCKSGHKFDHKNTYVTINKKGVTHRMCRKCHAKYVYEKRHKDNGSNKKWKE